MLQSPSQAVTQSACHRRGQQGQRCRFYKLIHMGCPCRFLLTAELNHALCAEVRRFREQRLAIHDGRREGWNQASNGHYEYAESPFSRHSHETPDYSLYSE
jgi:hypothetical protein